MKWVRFGIHNLWWCVHCATSIFVSFTAAIMHVQVFGSQRPNVNNRLSIFFSFLLALQKYAFWGIDKFLYVQIFWVSNCCRFLCCYVSRQCCSHVCFKRVFFLSKNGHVEHELARVRLQFMCVYEQMFVIRWLCASLRSWISMRVSACVQVYVCACVCVLVHGRVCACVYVRMCLCAWVVRSN